MIKDFFDNVKWFIQRGKRGWADCDAWDTDTYLAAIIPAMVKSLKVNGYGLPTLTEDKSERQAEDEWNNILDDIIFAWESHKKMAEGDWLYSTAKTRTKMENVAKNCIHVYLMTKEECERYRKGMQLFIKYLSNLWD